MGTRMLARDSIAYLLMPSTRGGSEAQGGEEEEGCAAAGAEGAEGYGHGGVCLALSRFCYA